MSKLLNYLVWLTVPDAARRLSEILGETVSEATVLRLGLDGHLKLSLRFVNHARGRRGRVSRYSERGLAQSIAAGQYPEDLAWVSYSAKASAAALLGGKAREQLSEEQIVSLDGVLDGSADSTTAAPLLVHLASLKIDEERYLTLERDVVRLPEICDLPMIGADALAVEQRYQDLTDGPEVTLTVLEGAFVEHDGYVYQLQEHLDENECMDGSRAQGQMLERAFVGEDAPATVIDAMGQRYRALREKFLGDVLTRRGATSAGYYPAHALPHGSVIVVRTAALQAFERSLLSDVCDVVDAGSDKNEEEVPKQTYGIRPVTTSELLECLRLEADETRWRDKLSRIDTDGKAYKPALVQRGRRGVGGSALWNPAAFAICLMDCEGYNAMQLRARLNNAKTGRLDWVVEFDDLLEKRGVYPLDKTGWSPRKPRQA